MSTGGAGPGALSGGCSSAPSRTPSLDPHSFALIRRPDALISACRLTTEGPFGLPPSRVGVGATPVSSPHSCSHPPLGWTQVSRTAHLLPPGPHPHPPADFICLTSLSLALPLPVSAPPSCRGQARPALLSAELGQVTGRRRTEGVRRRLGTGAETWERSSQSPRARAPLNLSAMGEMEQLRQEAEQLKKQIAVTPEPSRWGPQNTELWTRGSVPWREGLGFLLGDALETSDLAASRPF